MTVGGASWCATELRLEGVRKEVELKPSFFFGGWDATVIPQIFIILF